MLRKRAKRLGLLLVLIGFAALLTALGVWRFGSWIGFFLVYSWMLDVLTSYGLNSHLAAIISVAAGLVVWAGAVYLWKRNRRWGLVIVAALMVLQSAFLFCLEKNRYFSAKNGEPIKYYSVNPLTREIQVFDRPVYDAFGQKAQPVNFPIAQEIARQKHRERFPNEEVRPERIKNFFDPRTGEPVAYWCRDNHGDIHLFLRGGFDNKSGQRLKPVTEEVVEEALAQAAKLRQEAIPSPQPQQEAASPSQPPQETASPPQTAQPPTALVVPASEDNRGRREDLSPNRHTAVEDNPARHIQVSEGAAQGTTRREPQDRRRPEYGSRREDLGPNRHVTTGSRVSPQPPWKTIRLGTYKSAEELHKALLEANVEINDHSVSMLKKVVLAAEPTEVELVRATVAELGFPNHATLTQIYAAGLKRGWQLCPAEVGPQLWLQYPDLPAGEHNFIAMELIDGGVFVIERGEPAGGYPACLRDGSGRWVFCHK